MPSDWVRNTVDFDLVVILGFILAVVLAGRSPLLLAVFGGFVFVGWLLVQIGIFDDEADETTDARPQDPLETLQVRYANGEIDEAEFEHRLDRILASTDAVQQGSRRRRDRDSESATGTGTGTDTSSGPAPGRAGADSPSDRIGDREFADDVESETEYT